MTTNVRELLGDLRRQMTPANGDYLDRLMKRPEVQKVLDADERELVAARVALVTKLKAAPSQHAKACEAAGKAHAAASTLVEKKRKELAAGIATALLCVFDLRQYDIFFVQGGLYELVTGGLLHALRILK